MPARQYIALLRAVNVGGRTVTMERLRSLFSEIGLKEARTFIQSGNVFFETSVTDRVRLTRRIERHLSAALGYDVPVFVRGVEELETIVESSPFRKLTPGENDRFCVIFTSAPVPADFRALPRPAGNDFDVLKIGPGELFVVARLVKGRPSNPGAFIEKTLGVKTTTRFFHTVVKMLDAARA